MSESGEAYDPAKDAANRARYGLSLTRYVDLEVLAFLADERFDYGQPRYQAWGVIDGKAHCPAFTVRNGRVRPIGPRRAHGKEMERHVR